MKEQIKKMKQELKVLALQIKEMKKQRDRENGGFVYGLHEKRVAFRHKHVAYCLARGRTIEQVDSGNSLNMDYVNWYMDTLKSDSKKKLYVIVNSTLTPSQQAVQAGHAVAEFLIKNPNTQWRNGYLVYLTDRPYNYDVRSCSGLRIGFQEYAEFKEPDLENHVTAYATFGPQAEALLQRYKLLQV